MATIASAGFGLLVFVIVMGIGVIWRMPNKRFPDPPPGYYDWLKKTSGYREYGRKLREAAKEK